MKEMGEKETADFYFIQEEDPEKALNQILTLCSERIPKHFRFHPIRDIQVLTPMHKGVLGAINLNIELQRRLNPDQPSVLYGSRTFHLQDKVMQIVNNYEKEVFNGDIGWVSRINQEDRELTIDFDGRQVPYDFSELDEVVLAYAISVHKSQGSEYPVVIFPVTTQHFMLLQRNLIYTGMTRAKRLVILIGTKKALWMAIKNNRLQRRFTQLSRRLVA
jgi:exodeoxyribonuclease V alpha subunit